MFKKIFAGIAVFMLALMLVSCSGKTPSGKKYEEKSSNMESAVSAVNSADTKTNALSDISYTVFYSLKFRDLTGENVRGVKNTVSVSKNGTDDVSASIKNTYYGNTDTVSEVFAYKNGSAYSEMYGAGFSADMTYADFNSYIEKQRYTADKTFLDTKSFSKVTNYTLGDGSSEIVFKNPASELSSLIAKFIGLDSSGYVYTITNTVLTVNVSADGNISDKHLTFIASYHEKNTPDKVVTYNGDFSYTVEKTSDVTVDMPSGQASAQKISSLNLLRKFTNGYTILALLTEIDATYDRYIKNSDYTGAVYEMRDKVHFTEGYKNGDYLYGSIDDRYIILEGDKTTSSKGMFLDANGKYHARNSEGSEENDAKAPYSDEEFVEMVYSTLSAELVAVDDITGMTVTETEDTVIFKYAFNDKTIPSYSEYLLAAFSYDGSVSIELDNVQYLTLKNENVVTIRKSDGCIISHTVDFAVIFGGTLSIETKFNMTINATGSEVEVLDVSDWGNHSFAE